MFFKRKRPYDKPLLVPRDPDSPWQSEARGELDPIPRALLIVRPKEPYLKWLRACGNVGHTIATARKDDCGVYLIPPVSWFDSKTDDIYEDAGAREFIAEFWRHFFAQALECWEPDPATWPKDRTFAMFQKWFEIEVRETVLDLGNYDE